VDRRLELVNTKIDQNANKNKQEFANKQDIATLTSAVNAVKSSVAKLEQSAKCNFKGTLKPDGKSCTCEGTASGLFCEKVPKTSCKQIEGKKDGIYEILQSGKLQKVYCIMSDKWDAKSNKKLSGGWQVLTMFGNTGDFGSEVSKTTKPVRIKSSGFPTSNRGNINRKFQSYNLGWSSTTDYVWHSYCGAGKPYAFDWHDSGPAVGEVYLKLPSSGFSEYAIKFGNCYSGCVTYLFQGGNQVKTKSSCGGNRRNCFSTFVSEFTPGQQLKLTEASGTCVGSIYWVLVR
jgi:hypothetical protein